MHTKELLRQHELLALEYKAEKEELQRKADPHSIRRKVKRGDAWFPTAVGKAYYNSLDQCVVECSRVADTEVEHNFEHGRAVAFFHAGEDGDGAQFLPFVCTVCYSGADSMVVEVPSMEAASRLQKCWGAVGVQLSFDETTYRALFDALDRVIAAKDGRLAHLRDLFHSTAPVGRLSLPEVLLPWLNPTQQKAVNEVLAAKDVAVVHGPPGTGKTTTLVEAIVQTLAKESQVLVAAQSNKAVDWISSKLMEQGVAVLRIGNPARVGDSLLAQTFERRFEAHPDYHQLWSIRKAMRELRGGRGNTAGRQRKLEQLKERAVELEIRINADVFASARVVACTLTGAASKVMAGQRFPTLFIDEAAQAMEAACWIAIRRAGRVILAGDHLQLPPTVKSPEAVRGGLGKTLMETIVENHPGAVTLLKVQYRMSEKIMRFPSVKFYGGMVESAPEVAHRGILDMDTPMEWIDTAGSGTREEFVGETFGRTNHHEARIAVEAMEKLLQKVGLARFREEGIDVGIISPYRAQVQLIRRLAGRSSVLKAVKGSISAGTVDSFQGQERDVVIVSAVRSNEKGEIGFLRDLRRMNVAITRARMKLIIIGDSGTLCRHGFYRDLHAYCESLRGAD